MLPKFSTLNYGERCFFFFYYFEKNILKINGYVWKRWTQIFSQYTIVLFTSRKDNYFARLSFVLGSQLLPPPPRLFFGLLCVINWIWFNILTSLPYYPGMYHHGDLATPPQPSPFHTVGILKHPYERERREREILRTCWKSCSWISFCPLMSPAFSRFTLFLSVSRLSMVLMARIFLLEFSINVYVQNWAQCPGLSILPSSTR